MGNLKECEEALNVIVEGKYIQFTSNKIDGKYKMIIVNDEVDDLDQFRKEKKAIKIVLKQLNRDKENGKKSSD